MDFLAKYVRPEKVDGLYLPKLSDDPPKPFIWLWWPEGGEVPYYEQPEKEEEQ